MLTWEFQQLISRSAQPTVLPEHESAIASSQENEGYWVTGCPYNLLSKEFLKGIDQCPE